MYTKFEQIINEKGLRYSDVARGAGIPYSTITDWKAGRCTPKIDKIQKIADFLEVPIEYFYPNSSQKSENSNFTELEREIIFAFRQADFVDQTSILRILNLEKKQGLSGLKEA